jgi:hypothetical protein
MVTDVCVKLWLPRKQREVLLESEEGSRGGASWPRRRQVQPFRWSYTATIEDSESNMER